MRTESLKHSLLLPLALSSALAKRISGLVGLGRHCCLADRLGGIKARYFSKFDLVPSIFFLLALSLVSSDINLSLSLVIVISINFSSSIDSNSFPIGWFDI